MVFLSYVHISSLVVDRMCLKLGTWLSPRNLGFVSWYRNNIKYILPSTSLLVWIHERNTIKLHVQMFLRMKTCMFETRRRHYN